MEETNKMSRKLPFEAELRLVAQNTKCCSEVQQELNADALTRIGSFRQRAGEGYREMFVGEA